MELCVVNAEVMLPLVGLDVTIVHRRDDGTEVQHYFQTPIELALKCIYLEPMLALIRPIPFELPT